MRICLKNNSNTKIYAKKDFQEKKIKAHMKISRKMKFEKLKLVLVLMSMVHYLFFFFKYENVDLNR